MFTPVPTPAEIRAWDAAAIALGVPEDVLMENAAREALATLRRHAPSLGNSRVLLLAGGGNNGGDAACLARYLLDAGAKPLLALTRPPETWKGAAARWLDLALRLGVPWLPAERWLLWAKRRECPVPLSTSVDQNPDETNTLFFLRQTEAEAWLRADEPLSLVVDGLLGTGFAGPLRRMEADLIAQLHAEPAFVLALDLPSGLDAVSGRPCPDAVRAHVTVTFQAPKPGLLLPEAAPFVGKLEVRPIGIPRRVREENPASFRLWREAAGGPSEPGISGEEDGPYTLERGLVLPQRVFPANAASGRPFALRETPNNSHSGEPFFSVSDACPTDRSANATSLRFCPSFSPAHKGESGRVLILGGCAAYAGAPRLAAWGALRGGAGLVTVAAPDAIINAVRADLPEVVTHALPSSPDGLPWHEGQAEMLIPDMRHAVLVVGPGMGRQGTVGFLNALLRLPERPPLVLDADALFALHVCPGLLSLLHAGDILTPHPGEAAMLLGCGVPVVQGDRFAALRGLSQLADAVWVLKGPGTLIAAPGRPTALFPFHVPNLAVGGSGDVLAGLIGALRTQLPADQAACQAVYRHAQAGLRLARRFPLRGNGPRDIADALAMDERVSSY